MAGASIKGIQELAGHKTLTMFARYSQLSPEHRLSVIDRIASATVGKSKAMNQELNSVQVSVTELRGKI
jgi:hypothetical protein